MTLDQAHLKATNLSIEGGIRKAIEGGYKFTVKGEMKIFGDKIQFVDYENENDEGYPMVMISIEKIILDPLYWQALSKAEGWKGTTYIQMGSKFSNNVPDWLYHQHRFIDALNEDI